MCITPRPDNLTADEHADIDKRVIANVQTFNQKLYGTDKVAAQYLFSQMRWLEQIATLAAEKNEVVEGQYVDEIVHRESFETVAEYYGGLRPPTPEVNKLLEYIDQHDGVDAYILLNYFGESWLDAVFERVGSWGYWDGLFESIEADEERHHDGAMSEDAALSSFGYEMPDQSRLNDMARTLEKLLSDIMACPHFSYPMIYFGGETESAQVGLDICDAHEEVCDHLGIEHDTRNMRKFCRGQRFLASKAPYPIEMNGWERSKMNLWKQPAEMSGYFNGVFKSSNPIYMQIDLMKAVSEALYLHPRLNRVVRNDKIWQLRENIVGMRIAYDENQVSTVYEKNLWSRKKHSIAKSIIRKQRKIKSKPFQEVIDMHDIVNILPPARCAVVCNWSGAFGHNVRGPLNAIEGVPIQIMIGEAWPVMREGELIDVTEHYEATITITMDHRVGDGKDINLLGHEIDRILRREVEK